MTLLIDYWSELDGEVLRLLEERPHGLSFEELGHKLGMSPDAARSIVTMLSHEGRAHLQGVATL